MKILLINPTGHKIGMDHFLSAPPLGLMTLAATVPEHEVKILDLRNYNFSQDYVEKQIKKYDIIGVSCSTSMINETLKLCKIAKENDVKTVVGGYHVSLVPETALYPEIDVTVRGEGEVTFPKLVDALEYGKDLKKVKGLYFSSGITNGNQLIRTEDRPIIDINTSPFPRRDLVRFYDYHYFWASIDAIESSRGCPFNCHFCCEAGHWGRGWRPKTPERVIEEFHHMDKNKRWFIFNDSESTLDMKRMQKIAELSIEYGYHKKWKSCQGRVTDVVHNPRILDKMADAGWRMMFIGIESIHQKSIDTIGKGIKIKDIKNAVKMLHDRGITIFGSIIIGNLGETADDVRATIRFAQDLDIDIMQFTPLTPYPSTRLYQQAVENNWIVDRNFENWNLVRPIMRSDMLTADEIFELVKWAYRDFYFRFREKHINSFFIRAIRRFIPNLKFWWFWKMAPKFVINGLKNSKPFIADLTSKEYAARFKAKKQKKVKKMMERADKKRDIKINGLTEKLEKKVKEKSAAVPIVKLN
ncbi:MAG: radical SAM protein [Candidatus Lokiarchaeota archaeon]|nr:radical SAM protein [Candidatus Lokiarchaeota archaeon]